MNSSESTIYDEYRADQMTYDMLYGEWAKNYPYNKNDSSITNDTLRSIFDNLIKMFSPEIDPKFHSKKIMKNTLVIVLYSLIILVSLFGNLLVCYIILSKHRLRSRTTNILIANLTISDLIMTTLNVPITTGNYNFISCFYFKICAQFGLNYKLSMIIRSYK